MKISILGSGPGGYVAAIRAAQLGAQVTVIEESEVGGTCLNWGCIPTKALVATAEVLSKIRRAEDFGILIRGDIYPDFSRINERKDRIVSTQVKGLKNLFRSHGITLKEGRGHLVSPGEIRFQSKNSRDGRILSDRVIIATGSSPVQIPAFPFDGGTILSSTDALKLTAIPKSILIIGAGIIGCEFACIFREFGAEVTIIEALSRAVSSEDMEISEVLEREFRKKKIKLLKDSKAEKVVITDEGVKVLLNGGREISGEKMLVAVGRDFNSKGIGLEAVGVRKGDCGEVIVNDRMETNIPGIYAIGDVTGGPLLAHVASREGLIAAANIMGRDEKLDMSAVPSAIFTSPEIASVGLREFQADEKGIKVKTGHFQFRALAKSHAIGEIDGFIKVVSDHVSDRVIGVHIIGPHASDLIHEATLAVRKKLTVRDVIETIHAHPTLSEGIWEAFEDVHNEAIHIPGK